MCSTHQARELKLNTRGTSSARQLAKAHYNFRSRSTHSLVAVMIMCRPRKPVNQRFPYVCFLWKIMLLKETCGGQDSRKSTGMVGSSESGGGKDNEARRQPPLPGCSWPLHKFLFNQTQVHLAGGPGLLSATKSRRPGSNCQGGSAGDHTRTELTLLAGAQASSVKRGISAAFTHHWHRTMRGTQVSRLQLCSECIFPDAVAGLSRLARVELYLLDARELDFVHQVGRWPASGLRPPSVR